MNTAGVVLNSFGFYSSNGRTLYFDWTFLLLIAGAVVSLIASGVMRSYTSKYSKVRSSSGLTGAQAAQVILQKAGVTGVQIRPILGNLTDHYDPRTKVVNLAEESYDNPSLTGIGVAAHECGHAIQDAEGYGPLRLRSSLVPVVNFGSTLSWPIFIAGIVFSFQPLLTVGIILFSLAVVFQLVTLPVEIDASRRALSLLSESGLLQSDEIGGARKVLTAAAMTYVAALLSTVLQLIRMVLLARGSSRND
jgi:hypothetical protein